MILAVVKLLCFLSKTALSAIETIERGPSLKHSVVVADIQGLLSDLTSGSNEDEEKVLT